MWSRQERTPPLIFFRASLLIAGRKLVKNVPFHFPAVRRGESVAILGGKGAGKTSLLALLTGLDEPDSGFVCVAGYQINNRS